MPTIPELAAACYVQGVRDAIAVAAGARSGWRRRTMTEHELACVAVLAGVTMLPGSPQKRFAREMAWSAANARGRSLSEAQSMWLSSLVWTFRRQIKDKPLVAACGIRTRCAKYSTEPIS